MIAENQAQSPGGWAVEHFGGSELDHAKRGGLCVAEVALAVGRLGGRLNRKSDGLPGWITLWWGWHILQTLVEGVLVARKLTSSGLKTRLESTAIFTKPPRGWWKLCLLSQAPPTAWIDFSSGSPAGNHHISSAFCFISLRVFIHLSLCLRRKNGGT
jgi:hypothetical protein